MRILPAAGRILRCIALPIVCTCLIAGCGDILKVNNPVTIAEDQLDDPALEQFIMNGAIAEFQVAYANYVFWSGVLADETFVDHVNVTYNQFSQHTFDDLNTPNDSVYKTLQRARQAADDAADRVKKMQGANADSSINVARALIYGGYSYVLLGEGFCEAPVKLSAPLKSNELLLIALSRFEEGLRVAEAAGAKSANAAAALDLVRLAHVGAARVLLTLERPSEARAHAALVPESYARFAYYSENTVRENNPIATGTRFAQPFLGTQKAFLGLADVRAPQPSTPRSTLNSYLVYPPLRPSMYSGWTPTAAPQSITVASDIKFATGLEALYIVAESNGPNAAMLSLVNVRRSIVGQLPLNLSGDALLVEFRKQRAIDFFLTGQRLGDLRRYATAGNDMFPSGKMTVGTAHYGNMHCFIIPRSEKDGNPNF